jgi:DNA-binding protein YbaB
VGHVDRRPRGLNPDHLDLEGLLSGLRQFQGEVAESAQRVAIETADAWSRDNLVHVWVNAQGVVVQTEIDEAGLCEASASEVAKSVVEAAQAAAATMRARVEAFQAGVWQQVAELGVPSVGPLADVAELADIRPTVPLSGPDSRERREVADALAAAEHDGPEQWRLTIQDKG